MSTIEYLDGDALAAVETALGRVPFTIGANGRVALVAGLQPGEDLTPGKLGEIIADARTVVVETRVYDKDGAFISADVSTVKRRV